MKPLWGLCKDENIYNIVLSKHMIRYGQLLPSRTKVTILYHRIGIQQTWYISCPSNPGWSISPGSPAPPRSNQWLWNGKPGWFGYRIRWTRMAALANFGEWWARNMPTHGLNTRLYASNASGRSSCSYETHAGSVFFTGLMHMKCQKRPRHGEKGVAISLIEQNDLISWELKSSFWWCHANADFCSQKSWVDLALAFNVTLALLVMTQWLTLDHIMLALGKTKAPKVGHLVCTGIGSQYNRNRSISDALDTISKRSMKDIISMDVVALLALEKKSRNTGTI